MIKQTTRYIVYLFAGLLTFAVSSSYAQETKLTDSNSQYGVTFESAGSYMKKHANLGGDEFIDDGNLANLIDCGRSKCNTNTHVCLTKEDSATRSLLRSASHTLGYYATMAATGATVGAGAGSVVGGVGALPGAGIGAISGIIAGAGSDGYIKAVATRYKCVPIAEQAKQEAKGWKVTTTGGVRTVKLSNAYGESSTKKAKIKDKQCYKAKEQKGEVRQYCLKFIGAETRVVAGDKEEDGCEVVPVRWYNNRKCNFCSLTGVLYSVTEKITALSRLKLAYSFTIVIALGMMIWIAMKTLIFVSSMTKQDAAKYITELIKQSFKFVIAFFALLYYDNVFYYIIYPLMSAGLKFGWSFVSVQSLAERFGDNLANLLVTNNTEALIAAYGQDNTILPAGYSQNFSNAYFNIALYAELENLAYNVNLQYTLLQTIGSSLWCLGGEYLLLQIKGGFENWGLGFACKIYGLAFCIFGFLLSLAFVFYMLDAIVQLGLVGALLPFLIASWPFKITSKYTSTGFKMFLNSVFTFMMMGLVVRISMELISQAILLNSSADHDGSSGLAALVNALDTIDTEKLKKMVNVWSIGFLIFVFACIMGFMMVNKVKSLTDQFASGGISPIAPSIATMGASTIKSAVSKVAAPTTHAVGKWASKKGKNASKVVAGAVVGAVTLRPLRHRLMNKVRSLGQDDANTNSNSRATVGSNSSNNQNDSGQS